MQPPGLMVDVIWKILCGKVAGRITASFSSHWFTQPSTNPSSLNINNNVTSNNSTRQPSSSHKRGCSPPRPSRTPIRSGVLSKQNRQLSSRNRNRSLRSSPDHHSLHQCIQGSIRQVVITSRMFWHFRRRRSVPFYPRKG